MMAIQEILRSLGGIFRWWIVVAPWEQAIRIRLGKNIRVLKSGIYWKIPGFDRVYLQSIRRRFSSVATQAVTTEDGKPLTVSGSLRYCITDIGKLYNTLHQAEDTIQTEAAAHVARIVRDHTLADCPPARLEELVNEALDFSLYGIGDVTFVVTDYVTVRTYRIIQCSPRDYHHGGEKGELSTMTSA